jgi:hypothetical protein
MSISEGNELVSKEVSVRHRGHMLQQAGYQLGAVLIVAGRLLQKHAFRNTSHCSFIPNSLTGITVASFISALLRTLLG